MEAYHKLSVQQQKSLPGNAFNLFVMQSFRNYCLGRTIKVLKPEPSAPLASSMIDLTDELGEDEFKFQDDVTGKASMPSSSSSVAPSLLHRSSTLVFETDGQEKASPYSSSKDYLKLGSFSFKRKDTVQLDPSLVKGLKSYKK